MFKFFCKRVVPSVEPAIEPSVVLDVKPSCKIVMKKSVTEKVGRSCKFDKIKDYQRVESGLIVDLTETLKTGIVKESNSILESNGIDDPESIVGMVRDRFDAIEADRAIRKYGKKADVGQYTSQVEQPKTE